MPQGRLGGHGLLVLVAVIMILIGQFDSPFVRRVAIALRLYGLEFEHRPWSTFRDVDKIGAINPMRRVPTLVLDDGEVLIESFAILDHLDEVAGRARALIPESGTKRRQALKIAALGTGLAEKAVALVYERALHETASEMWVERCRCQIVEVLEALERERKTRRGPWWFGDGIGHADIAVACALRFVKEAHPDLFDADRFPHLAAHSAACEALPDFIEISQTFDPPA